MKNLVKRFCIPVLFIFCITTFCGCGNKNTAENIHGAPEAEIITNAFLTAVSAFNLDAMNTLISQGTYADLGIDTTAISKEIERTSTYKESVRSMFRSLADTIIFNINSSKLIDQETALVDVTFQYVDANEEELNTFMQQKVDDYAKGNPDYFQLPAIEQEDISISVMADAYRKFMQIQPKVSVDIPITVVKVGNTWKVENSSINQKLIDVLSLVFKAV